MMPKPELEPSAAQSSGVAVADVSTVMPRPMARGRALERADQWALGLLAVWSGLVVVAHALVFMREANTLAYPIARILVDDLFMLFGDGHVIPRAGEGLTPSLAILIGGPPFWLFKMTYYPLEHLLGGVPAVTIERFAQLIIYLTGTPLVYRLLRHGKADRWVAVVLAAAYAVSPVALSRMLLWTVLMPAPFLLWSELGRIEGRPWVRAIGLVVATQCYPLTGFAAVILAFQDYRASTGPQRRTNRWILIATALALANMHVAALGLLQHVVSSELSFGRRVWEDMLGYRVFPFQLAWYWAEPVKLFEIAVFVAASCVFLLARPLALAPAIADVLYYAGTTEGIRDHGMVLSSIGLFTILGVRASLFEGGTRWRNGVLVAGAVFATVYGHAMAGGNGLIQLARAADPPRPHLADIAACVPSGQKRCVVLPSMYPGFAGPCEHVTTYDPAALEDLRIEDKETTVFVAPSRLVNDHWKGRAYEDISNGEILSALAAKVRSGQLHASVCGPWFFLFRSPDSAPSDPGVAARLERQSG